VKVKNGPVQRNLHNFFSQKLWISMRTCWKACRVYFPMNLVATSLDTLYCLQTRISTDSSEGQQSIVTECWYKLPSKTVPIYNVSCWLAYIAAKPFESSFISKKRFIIWTSQWKVMVSLLETALEANSHAKPLHESIPRDLSHCLPSKTLFRFHTYLAGLLLV